MARIFWPLLAACTLFAQQPRSTESGVSEKARIEGILVSATTQQPLKKGQLVLRPVQKAPQPSAPAADTSGAYVGTSDANGKFVIEGVSPGSYTLQADRPGYMQAKYRSTSGGIIAVDSGQSLKDIRVAMTPQGVIAGRVVDEDGDPMTNVRVDLERWGYRRGARSLVGFSQKETDDRGEFRIAGLPAGRYLLTAQIWQPAIDSVGKSTETYVTTFYPSAIDMTQSTPIAVSAGSEVTDIEVRLRKVRVFHVAGKIVEGQGAAVNNLGIQLVPAANGPRTPAYWDHFAIANNGKFDFSNVMPGEYVVVFAESVVFGTVDQSEKASRKLYARFPVTVSDANIADLVVPFHPGASLTGHVEIEGSAQSPGKPPKFPSVRLEAENESTNPYTANTAADGSLDFHDVAPHRYRISLDGAGDGDYLKSARFGDHDVTNAVLDLTESPTSGTLNVLVSPNAGDISGSVTNEMDEPVFDAVVTLGPLSSEEALETRFFRETRSGSDGQFSIKNLPPGDYRVVAWEEIEDDLVQDPEFRARFDDKSIRVKIEEKSHETTSLKLVSHASIEAESAKVR